MTADRRRPCRGCAWPCGRDGISSSESERSPAEMNSMGLPVTSMDGERAAAAGIAVHLRHDDAVEVDLLGKRRGNVDDILAGHGIDDHENLVGLDGVANARSASSIISLIDMQAARRVDDDDVAQVVDGVAHALGGDLDGVLAVAAIDTHVRSRRRASATGRPRRDDTRRRRRAGGCGPASSGGRRAWPQPSSCRSPARPTSMTTLGNPAAESVSCGRSCRPAAQ